MPRRTMIAVVVAALAAVAVAALPAGGAPSLSRSSVGGATQGCVPVAAAECGSVRVPLFRSRPGGPMIDIGYALIRHRDPGLPAARGTVVINPGGPGGDVISGAAQWVEQLAGLLADHDLLLIDPRGTGRSHAISCGVTGLPATRDGLVRALGALRPDAGARGARVHVGGDRR